MSGLYIVQKYLNPFLVAPTVSHIFHNPFGKVTLHKKSIFDVVTKDKIIYVKNCMFKI